MDLISRQAALDALTCKFRITGKENAETVAAVIDDFNNRIKALPSAQLERPKGKWIYGEHDIAMCDGYWCDQCGFFVPWDYKYKFIDFIKDYHWCPSCGADMRGEQA